MVCQGKKYNKKTIKGYGSAATSCLDPHLVNINTCVSWQSMMSAINN
jgi:hypothetical protein